LPLFPAERGRWGATMILEGPGIHLTDQTLRSGLSGFRSLVDPFNTYLSYLDAAAEARLTCCAPKCMYATVPPAGIVMLLQVTDNCPGLKLGFTT